MNSDAASSVTVAVMFLYKCKRKLCILFNGTNKYKHTVKGQYGDCTVAQRAHLTFHYKVPESGIKTQQGIYMWSLLYVSSAAHSFYVYVNCILWQITFIHM